MRLWTFTMNRKVKKQCTFVLPCVGSAYPSAGFSNQWTLVFHPGHFPSISSLSDTWGKQDLLMDCFYKFRCHASFKIRITFAFVTGLIFIKQNLQFIIHVLWLRHSVSFLKQACNFSAIHSWIGWTTYKKAINISSLSVKPRERWTVLVGVITAASIANGVVTEYINEARNTRLQKAI